MFVSLPFFPSVVCLCSYNGAFLTPQNAHYPASSLSLLCAVVVLVLKMSLFLFCNVVLFVKFITQFILYSYVNGNKLSLRCFSADTWKERTSWSELTTGSLSWRRTCVSATWSDDNRREKIHTHHITDCLTLTHFLHTLGFFSQVKSSCHDETNKKLLPLSVDLRNPHHLLDRDARSPM